MNKHVDIWKGLSGDERTAKAAAFALKKSREGKRTWWIVDTIFKMDNVNNELLGLSGGAVAGIDVLVAGRMGMFLADQLGEEYRLIDADERALLFRELLMEHNDSGFAPEETLDGWVQFAADTYERFVTGEIETFKPGMPYPWLPRILIEYDTVLERNGYLDVARVPVAVQTIFDSSPVRPDVLIVDRPGLLLPSIESLLHSIVRKSPETILLLDDHPEGGSACELAKNTLQDWRSRYDVQEYLFPGSQSNVQIAKTLFSMEKKSSDTTVPGKNITVGYFNDIPSEITAVARKIASLTRSEGVEEKRVALVVCDLETYAPIINELFQLYNIPTDLRLGARLSTSPVSRLVAQLFELRAGDVQREHLTEVLLNPYARWGEFLATNSNVLKFDGIARSAGIIGGKNIEKDWKEPLQHQLDLLAKKNRSPFHSDDDVSHPDRSSHIQWLQGAIREFDEIMELLFSLPDSCTVEQALTWLDTFLDRLGTISTLHSNRREKTHEGQRDRLAFGRIRLLLTQVEKTLTIAGKTEWPIERISETITYAISQDRFRPPSRVREGITVCGALDVKGVSCDHLFFAGMSNEYWPKKPSTDLLDPYAFQWRGKLDRLAESRSLTLSAILRSENVYITAPCAGEEGGREAPSPLLLDLERSGLTILPWETLESLHSVYDLQVQAGNHIHEQYTWDPVLKTLATAVSQIQESSVFIPFSRLCETIDVERIRQNPATLSRWEGYLANSALWNRLKESFEDSPLSVTRLKTYAQCPMRYFMHYLLRLLPLEDVEEDLDSAQVGQMVHEIMALAARKTRQEDGFSISLADLEDAEELFLSIIDEVSANYSFDNLFWEQTLKKIRSGLKSHDDDAGVIALALDFERKKLKGERIRFAEASFGMDYSDYDQLFEGPLEITDGHVKVRIQGQIDRVSFNEKKGWRIWDYKVKKNGIPTKTNIRKGVEFQLPVYTLALEKYLKENVSPDEQIERGCFFQIKPDTVSESGQWNKKDHDDFREELIQRIITIFTAMQKGYYHQPLSQDTLLCNSDKDHNYCPFFTVCRRDPDLFRQRETSIHPKYLKAVYKLSFQNFVGLNEAE